MSGGSFDSVLFHPLKAIRLWSWWWASHPPHTLALNSRPFCLLIWHLSSLACGTSHDPFDPHCGFSGVCLFRVLKPMIIVVFLPQNCLLLIIKCMTRLAVLCLLACVLSVWVLSPGQWQWIVPRSWHRTSKWYRGNRCKPNLLAVRYAKFVFPKIEKWILKNNGG